MGAAGGLVASLASGNKSKSLNSSPASEGEVAGGWSEIIVESAVQNDVQLEGHNVVKGNNNDGPFRNDL